MKIVSPSGFMNSFPVTLSIVTSLSYFIIIFFLLLNLAVLVWYSLSSEQYELLFVGIIPVMIIVGLVKFIVQGSALTFLKNLAKTSGGWCKLPGKIGEIGNQELKEYKKLFT